MLSWGSKNKYGTKFERNPDGVVRVTAPSAFTSKMVAILNDIYLTCIPQTIPDVGVKFQTI